MEENYDKIDQVLEAVHNLTDTLQDVLSKESESEAVRSSDLKELFAAMAKAQAEMVVADLNKDNPFFKSKYADMRSIVMASRPSLAKNGLCVLQSILTGNDGHAMLHTMLCHASGQFIESRMRINPPKSDVQSLSSYTTYLKRMAYASLVGVVTGDEDDDAEISMGAVRNESKPSQNWNQPREKIEYVTKEQLEILERELVGHADLAERLMKRYEIDTLSLMKKADYVGCLDRVRKIKLDLSTK